MLGAGYDNTRVFHVPTLITPICLVATLLGCASADESKRGTIRLDGGVEADGYFGDAARKDANADAQALADGALGPVDVVGRIYACETPGDRLGWR